MAVVHLDAGVIIGLLDAHDLHHAQAQRAMADALREGHGLAMAASAFAECLVGPYRRGAASVDVVRNLIDRLPIAVVPLDLETAASAARLRAAHGGLRLPDALVIATAAHHSAVRLVTTDRRWPTAKAMQLTLVIAQL